MGNSEVLQLEKEKREMITEGYAECERCGYMIPPDSQNWYEGDDPTKGSNSDKICLCDNCCSDMARE